MDSLKEIPEAKYIMDDLMKRTEKAENKYDDLKIKSSVLIHKCVQNIAMIQLDLHDNSLHNMLQIKRKEDAIKDLIILSKINS